MAAASDVPARYDLVLSGGSLSAPVGFVFLDALEPSLPFRTHRAIYGYSPTFIERQNVSGSFGDNQQDFFLTSSQKDWSEGEQQRYARVNDPDSARRYWQGTNVDVSVPGKATVRSLTTQTAAFGGSIVAMCGGGTITGNVFAASATNLYEIDNTGTITDRGAHGLGATPRAMSLGGGVTSEVFLSSLSGGTVGVRKWSVSAFSTFSAAGAHTLAFVGNTLYGIGGSFPGDSLIRYNTAGTASTLFTWQDAAGVAPTLYMPLLEYGGKILILRPLDSLGSTLWLFDGVAPSMIATLPKGFIGTHLAQVAGSIFISGSFSKRLGGANYVQPAIFYYTNGTLGLLWKANDFMLASNAGSVGNVGTSPCIATDFGSGLVFTDDTRGAFMYYDPAAGGVSTLGSYTVTAQNTEIASSSYFFLHSRTATTPYRFPADGYATSATVTSSLFDFDSSLNKFIRGVTVDFDSATDGDGGSIDIAYRVNDVDGTYTTLQTGAASGVEYVISGVTGHSISVRVTLNKGTSTSGPVLKRVSARAAPILTSYRTGEYVLDCTGDAGRSPRTLRDQTPNPLAGFESLAQLQIAKASTTPLTVTDRTGTYTGIVEQLEAYEEHPGLDDPTRSGEFVVKLIMRGI